MKLIRHQVPVFSEGTVVTIGNFDGVHRGHQALLEAMKRFNLPRVLVVFEPTPMEFFKGTEAPARLMRLREKILVLRDTDVNLFVLRFNKALMQQEACDFVKQVLLAKLNMKALIVGDDFRFGARRAGDIQLLRKMAADYQFDLVDVPTLLAEQVRISSTLIRQTLAAGKLIQATELLGRPYQMCGRVVHGQKLGRTLGFPTANLNVHRHKVPMTGIFVVKVLGLDQPYYGAANLGTRPAVKGERVLLEVFLFDFNQSIYGRYIEVQFLHKLRDEAWFESLEALTTQIHQDVRNAKQWLKRYV